MDFRLESLASLAIVGTIFGFIFKGWTSIKSFFQNLFGVFVIQIHLEDAQTSQAVLAHLVKRYKRSQMGDKTFGGKHESFRNGKYGHVPYEFFGGKNLVFWNGWIPIWFNVSVEKDEKAIHWGERPVKTRSSIYYLRYSVDAEQIVRDASGERNQLYWTNTISEHKRFFIKRVPDPTSTNITTRFSAGNDLAWYFEGVYRLLSHSPDELGRASVSSNGKPTNNLYFPPHIKKLVGEVGMWRNLQNWYNERAIPWKRGWVLYGPPGCVLPDTIIHIRKKSDNGKIPFYKES